MSHVTVSGVWGGREKVSHVTVSGGWGLGGVGKRSHMLRFVGFGGRREKVSRVTVSRVWGELGKGVTCYGFCGLEGGRKRCIALHVRIAFCL